RRDQRYRASGGGEVEGEPGTLRLSPDCAVMAALLKGRAAEQIEIEAVPDDVVGRVDQGAGFGRAPGRVARADADDRQPAARTADRGRPDRRRGAGNRAG